MSTVVNVGRPGPFGNPFRVGHDGTLEEVVCKHKKWFMSPEQFLLRLRAKKELCGKTLYCPGCRGKLPCHKTILEEVANA